MMRDEWGPDAIQGRRWRAVLARAAGPDEAFVYAVRSTGVFCRPTCPARRPRPDQVLFFDEPAAAIAAGFRACLRCRPLGGDAIERAARVATSACRRIEGAAKPPSLAELAGAASLSASHFARLFKSATGVTPAAYAESVRDRRRRACLAREPSVTDAVFAAGYAASSRFYADSAKTLGMSPKQYRDGGRGVDIWFATGASSLGVVLVAGSDKGLCAIALGDTEDELLRDLAKIYSRARPLGTDPERAALVRRAIAAVEEPALAHALPLDIRGTAFQRRVWDALRDIPHGSTATYAEVARAIDQPTAARAVARAIASNALAVAVPCHRVIRSDGSLAGYRWGPERKRRLLDRERSG